MFRVDIFNITSKNFELVQEASLKLLFPPFVSMMADLKTNFGAVKEPKLKNRTQTFSHRESHKTNEFRQLFHSPPQLVYTSDYVIFA